MIDRRRTSLALLLLFVLCTGAAIVLSGSRPGPEQGVAPTVVQFVGYLLALVAAVLLLTAAADTRGLGGLVLAALVVLVLVEVLGAGGPDIGAGFARLIALVVIMVATVRLALGVARAGRPG